MSAKLRNKIQSTFQIRGFSLRSDASKYLQELLDPLDEDKQTAWTKGILSWLQQQKLDSALIDKATLARCIEESRNGDSDTTDGQLFVVDAFKLSPLTYNEEWKKFVPRSKKRKPGLFGDADTKAFLFRERYKLVMQKTARHPCFSMSSASVATSCASAHADDEDGMFRLLPVEHLLGASGSDKVVVLGMLTQLKEGKYFLEDPTGAVEIDLSQTSFAGGLFTESGFVLAEGSYSNSVFKVQAMGLPPLEPAAETLKYLGGASVFSGFPDKARARHDLSDLPPDAMFVFLSDVWLDQAKVMSQLRILFAGYSQTPPTCLVLCGNFLSRSRGSTKDCTLLRECFKKLADLVCEFPQLVEQSHFVLVPGPQDPGLSNILPRPGLPLVVAQDFTSRVPLCHLASNPCRLLFYGREVVVFRQDGVARACRNTLHLPWEQGGLDIPHLYTKSLASNGHLCPVNLAVSPVFWEWDFALWLLPLPDAVVCADSHDPFSVTQASCLFFNPGSFPKTDFSFKVYLPASQIAEDSQISEAS